MADHDSHLCCIQFVITSAQKIIQDFKTLIATTVMHTSPINAHTDTTKTGCIIMNYYYSKKRENSY